MLDDLNQLRDNINGLYSEPFCEEYYAKYFVGDITLIIGDESYTMSFCRGKMVDYMKGIPISGIDIGLSGSDADWEEFYTHKMLCKMTNGMYEHKFQVLGNPIRARQNINPLAYLVKILAITKGY